MHFKMTINNCTIPKGNHSIQHTIGLFTHFIIVSQFSNDFSHCFSFFSLRENTRARSGKDGGQGLFGNGVTTHLLIKISADNDQYYLFKMLLSS